MQNQVTGGVEGNLVRADQCDSMLGEHVVDGGFDAGGVDGLGRLAQQAQQHGPV